MKKIFSVASIVLLVVVLIIPSMMVKAQESQKSGEEILKDPLTEMVVKADLIVLGTITDIKHDTVTIEPNGKVNYTTHTLSVENVIKGDPAITQLFIRTLGGEESGYYYPVNDRMLVLLNRGSDNFYTIYGIYWIESPTARARSTVTLQDAIGQIAKIMLAQNIPIALQEPVPIPKVHIMHREKETTPVPEPPKDSRVELTEAFTPEQQALLAAGWNDIMTEDFEGVFPPPASDWELYGNPTWDDDNYKPYNGLWSAWCANGGSLGLDPEFNDYPNNARS